MYILALDQALANTGWAVLECSENPKYIDGGVIKTRSNEETEYRIFSLLRELEGVIKNYPPKHLFLEEIHCPRNSPYSWPKLIAVESCLKIWALQQEIPYSSLAPQVNAKKGWRKALEINEKSKTASKEKLGIAKISEHLADAICIGLAGIILHNYVRIEDEYTKEISNLINDFRETYRPSTL